MDLTAIWPPYALTIRSEDLELSPVRESDYPELAEIAGGGVRRDGVEAFLIDWDAGTDAEIARSVAQYQWATRANFSLTDWKLEFTVRVSGRVVGVQAAAAQNYTQAGTIGKGSWLGRAEQGKGYGTRMRHALITAFARGFDAKQFHSAYIEGNDASRRVSERLGYSPNGRHTIVAQSGQPVAEHRVMIAATDIRPPAVPIEVEGAEVVRESIALIG